MSTAQKRVGGCIVPSLRYRDAPAAIAWLCEAFGFEEQLVVPGENGTIVHCQLLLGSDMIMLGSSNSHGGNAYDQAAAIAAATPKATSGASAPTIRGSATE